MKNKVSGFDYLIAFSLIYAFTCLVFPVVGMPFVVVILAIFYITAHFGGPNAVELVGPVIPFTLALLSIPLMCVAVAIRPTRVVTVRLALLVAILGVTGGVACLRVMKGSY